MIGLLVIAHCRAVDLAPRDPSAVFEMIDASIASEDYFKANGLLGSLMDSLVAVGVPPLTGQAHRTASDRGRENRDLHTLIQQAQFAWRQAIGGRQTWDQVMVQLAEASSSSVTLDYELPASVRYEQARSRYQSAPSIVLLHQMTLRAYEAGAFADTSMYLAQERVEIPKAYGRFAGPSLHRLETLDGILKFNAGDIDECYKIPRCVGQSSAGRWIGSAVAGTTTHGAGSTTSKSGRDGFSCCPTLRNVRGWM